MQDPSRDFNTSPDSVALGFVAVSFPRASSEGFSFSTGITAGQKLHFPEARDRKSSAEIRGNHPRKSAEIIRRLISCSSSISGAAYLSGKSRNLSPMVGGRKIYGRLPFGQIAKFIPNGRRANRANRATIRHWRVWGLLGGGRGPPYIRRARLQAIWRGEEKEASGMVGAILGDRKSSAGIRRFEFP